ncbi:MAG TPA: carbohydrate kinase family protein [Anaerolineaceae bacterium]|jgi:adenosine kinase
MDILCNGSIAYDYLMTFPGYFRDHILVDRLDTISLSFLVDSLTRQRGGTATNIAYTLALLGGRPRLMATVGEDFTEYRAWLESMHIDTANVRAIPGLFTASFFANTDQANAQISSFYTGAMARAGELSLHELQGGKPDLVVISAHDPVGMRRTAEECRELGIRYLYDPSQQVVRIDPEDIRRGVEGAWALFVNEYEYELVQKHTGMTLKNILATVELVVVTCGEQGARIYRKDGEISIPAAPPCRIVDPTGVGDAFRGGFLTGTRLNLDLETCGRIGALAATYCIEQKGTQNHTYTTADFLMRYERTFGTIDRLRDNLSSVGE